MQTVTSMGKAVQPRSEAGLLNQNSIRLSGTTEQCVAAWHEHCDKCQLTHAIRDKIAKDLANLGEGTHVQVLVNGSADPNSWVVSAHAFVSQTVKSEIKPQPKQGSHSKSKDA